MKTKNIVFLALVIGLFSFIIGHESRKPVRAPEPARLKILIDSSGTRPAWTNRDSTMWMDEEGCICFLGVSHELLSLDSVHPIRKLILERSSRTMKEMQKEDPTLSWRARVSEVFWEKHLVKTADGIGQECFTVYILVRYHLCSPEETPSINNTHNPRLQTQRGDYFSENLFAPHPQ